MQTEHKQKGQLYQVLYPLTSLISKKRCLQLHVSLSASLPSLSYLRFPLPLERFLLMKNLFEGKTN
jgi:hypothetical protein